MWTEHEGMLFPFVKYLDVGVGMLKSCLIDFPACIEDPFLLVLTAGLMINGELANDLSESGTHDSSTVTNIGHMDEIAIEEGYNGTGARSIQPTTL